MTWAFRNPSWNWDHALWEWSPRTEEGKKQVFSFSLACTHSNCPSPSYAPALLCYCKSTYHYSYNITFKGLCLFSSSLSPGKIPVVTRWQFFLPVQKTLNQLWVDLQLDRSWVPSRFLRVLQRTTASMRGLPFPCHAGHGTQRCKEFCWQGCAFSLREGTKEMCSFHLTLILRTSKWMAAICGEQDVLVIPSSLLTLCISFMFEVYKSLDLLSKEKLYLNYRLYYYSIDI